MSQRFDTSRSGEVFRVQAVDPLTLAGTADVGTATGGSVELGAFTDTRMDASVDFEGEAVPDAEMVRIWYAFSDDRGERGEYPLATGYAAVGDLSIEGGRVSGTLTVASPLRILAGDGPGYPYTVKAGTAAVALAADICESQGLHVIDSESSWSPSSDHVFEASDSWLAVVNWLLTSAGFAAAWPDAMGWVHMEPYRPPSDRAVAASFANDSASIIVPGIVRTTEGGGAVVRLSYSDEQCSVRASAWTGGTALRDSVRETVDELDGDTAAAKAESLIAEAERRAMDAAGTTERLKFKAAWVPIVPNDAVAFDYASDSEGARIEGWRGSVASMSISLEPSAPSSIELRRLLPHGGGIETEGGVLWEEPTSAPSA